MCISSIYAEGKLCRLILRFQNIYRSKKIRRKSVFFFDNCKICVAYICSKTLPHFQCTPTEGKLLLLQNLRFMYTDIRR